MRRFGGPNCTCEKGDCPYCQQQLTVYPKCPIPFKVSSPFKEPKKEKDEN